MLVVVAGDVRRVGHGMMNVYRDHQFDLEEVINRFAEIKSELYAPSAVIS